MAKNIKNYEFKAEMKQLLNIIIHSLYTNPEIFLRELVSNSSDALNKLRFRRLTDTNILDPEVDLTIKINVDKENKSFTIEDTGIGMTKEDLINRIGTIASSGTLDFLKKAQDEQKTLDGDLIGKFGVGFYSAYMVTDEITIDTVYSDIESKGFKWISKGEEKFKIEDSDKTSRGTKISFVLKDEFSEFSDAEKIKSLLKKYSNFVDFPIFVNGEEIKKIKPLWQRNKDEINNEELNEFYKFITNDYEEPLGSLHFAIEGNINFKSLVFISKTAPMTMFSDILDKSLNLYSSRIFIQNDCKELLPDYLRFLRGVVDTEDLPLNISREVTQSSPLMTKMRNIITGKVLSLLEDWAENNKEKYEEFFRAWGSLFKTGMNSDFANKDRIVDLARYETSELEKGKFKSLKDYVKTMQEGQNDIYYIMGDNRELIERNPNLEYFKSKGIEVIYLFDPVDVFTFPYIHNYDGKNIKSIDKADIDLSNKEVGDNKETDKNVEAFIARIKEILGDNVEEVSVSKRLVDSPVTLVVGSKGLDPQMEKMMQYMDKDYQGGKKNFEINTNHQLVKNLMSIYEKLSNDEIISKIVWQLFEGALLMDGNLKTPVNYLQRMNDIMLKASEISS
jgi:molecular chaperone HtpG